MLCEPLFGKCLEPSLPHLTHLWHYACSQGLQAPVTGLALIYIHWQPANLLIFSFCGIMVKCLIRISTRVNVHLRMINHCYRDVKVHVLSLGPRLLGKALGVLPLYPAITSQQEAVQAFPLPATPQPCVLSSTSSGAVYGLFLSIVSLHYTETVYLIAHIVSLFCALKCVARNKKFVKLLNTLMFVY